AALVRSADVVPQVDLEGLYVGRLRSRPGVIAGRRAWGGCLRLSGSGPARSTRGNEREQCEGSGALQRASGPTEALRPNHECLPAAHGVTPLPTVQYSAASANTCLSL